MLRKGRANLTGVAVLVASLPASARGGLRGAESEPPLLAAGEPLWCWAASGQMVMEWLGEAPEKACQCRQAEQVLGVTGCCVSPRPCLPAADAPSSCDEPRWPAFVERSEGYGFDYETTCDALPGRQDDDACDAKPLGWRELTAEICAGRPVLASFRSRGSVRGHMLVVKGFRARPSRRVLLVDPMRLCPPERDCEGELDEGFWLPYEEFAAGWDGRVHWVDFYGIRRASPENAGPRPSTARRTSRRHGGGPGGQED